MNIIKIIKRWWWRDQPVNQAINNSRGKAGTTLKGEEMEYFYPKKICPKDYGNHEKGDVCILFGYRIDIIDNNIEALYHCKKCQKVLHFPLNKNPKEKELYNKRLKETKNFTKPITIK